jgi:Flp pilus assembly protein TadB
VIILLLLGVLLAAFVYFGINYLRAASTYRASTKIQRWTATIEESKERESRGDLPGRIQRYLSLRGWNGNVLPLVAAALLLYTFCAILLNAAGIHSVFNALASFALAWVIIVTINRRIYEKRREKFRRQLMQLITMMATQIQDIGTGPQRALAQLVPQLEDPLGTEMANVLAQVSATRDLVGALTELETRYPSRAFSMFIATLEMSESVGGVGIASALRRVAAILNRDFELNEEANAEVAQTRSEFYAVTAIIAFICFVLFEKSGSTNRAAYESPMGIVGLIIGIGNYIIGLFRVRKALASAKGRD